LVKGLIHRLIQRLVLGDFCVTLGVFVTLLAGLFLPWSSNVLLSNDLLKLGKVSFRIL